MAITSPGLFVSASLLTEASNNFGDIRLDFHGDLGFEMGKGDMKMPPTIRTSGTVLLLLLLLISACLAPVAGLYPPKEEEKAKRVYIIRHGWHTGIAIAGADLSPAIMPELGDFAKANHLEFGWGDWDYYQAEEESVWMTTKAAFWPTRSVLHVIGIEGPVDKYYSDRKIVGIGLSHEGFERLEQFIAATFLRPPGESAQPMPGQLPNSRFYPARGEFHIFRTCNTWVAEALRASGYPVTPLYAITAGNLMYQVSRFGRARQNPEHGR